jgi:hypothetical protein
VALSSDFKKNQQQNEDLEEVLEGLEKLLERTKVMYEQYFMGIQKVAPMQLHRDVERKVRELTQQQIRNTGLRFRFTTLCQKFGAYNTYWKRTLREIEQGRYVRDLVRVKRKVEQAGEDLPEELLVKLPKLVQDRIRRDRARMARTRAHELEGKGVPVEEGLAALDAAVTAPRQVVHEISGADAESFFDDDDIDSMFGSLNVGATAPPPLASLQAAEPVRPPERRPAPPIEAKPPPIEAKPPPVQPPRAFKPIEPPRAVKAAMPGRPLTEKMPSIPRPDGVAPAVPPPVPPPLRSAAPAKPAAQAPKPPEATRPAPPPGMSEKQCRELHARYAKARELVGDRSEVSYDKLVATLNRQAPGIMKEHGARGVDFQVVVRGDKVILKAKPVK